MNVTKENFDVVLPHFRQLLQTSSFYALDMEMTGIRFNDQPPLSSVLETPEAEWPINYAIAKKFSPIQIGICLFHKKAATAKDSIPAIQVSLGSQPAVEKSLKSAAQRVADIRNEIAGAPVALKGLPEAKTLTDKLTAAEGVVFELARKHMGIDKEASEEEGSPKAAAEELSVLVEADIDRIVSQLLGELAAASADLRKRADRDGSMTATGKDPISDELGDLYGAYEARPFNFYIFPSEIGDMTLDRTTVSDFLAKHGMDFQKWIVNGIPYVTREKASEMRRAAAKRHMNKVQRVVPNFNQELLGKVPKEDVGRLTDLMVEAEKVAAGNDPKWSVRVPYLKNNATYNALDSKRASLGLEWRKETVKGKPMNVLAVPQTVSGGDGDANGEQAAEVSEIASAEKAIGATKMIEALIESRKPIIAHNSFKDFLFLYTAFHSTTLESYGAFKKFLVASFPSLYDTKTIVNLDAVHDPKMIHMLQREYEFFRDQQNLPTRYAPVSIQFPIGFDSFDPKSSESTNAAHDASYDAMMTGCLFLYGRRALVEHKLPVSRFKNTIPLYGLAYSCMTERDEDLVPHDGDLVHIMVPDSVRLDMGRVCSTCIRYDIPGRVGPQYRDKLVYVSKSAKGGGSLIDASVSKLQESFSRNFPGVVVTKIDFKAGWDAILAGKK